MYSPSTEMAARPVVRPQAYRTVPEMFLERVARTPNREAYRYRTQSGWQTLTWGEAAEKVRAIACGLRALGLEPEGRCGILSGTRLEWILADLAILSAGGATTTIYPANTAEESAFIVSDSGCTLVFAEDQAQAQKLIARRAELPALRRVIILEGEAGGDELALTLAALMEKGRELDAQDRSAYERIARAVRADALATLIYTSGTTGQPKGVELTHDAWVYESEAVEELGLFSESDVQYLWLPLAHVFGKIAEISPLRVGFATAIDGDVNRMVDNLATVRPTFVCAVPRVFEKIHHRAVLAAAAQGKVKEAIFRAAFALGRRAASLRHEGKDVPPWLARADALADRLVFSKLRERFGGRLHFMISGSAPLPREIAEFFHAAKILVLEGYGLTESSAASCGNVPSRYRFGSVGRAVPGTEIKISDEDGEILIRGRGVMRGYHNLSEATRDALTEDGWLRTGDIGRLDEDGFLYITDRKKDLIKTANGKYVAPQEIEGKLKASCPLLSQVFVHGDNRTFVSALVTLDQDAVREWGKANGLASLSYAELTRAREVHARIQASVDALNRELARHKAVRKFAVLPRELTQEAGELTPSLKMKRKVVERHFASVLSGFYEGAPSS